jgi:type I restriction enzyme S subunit
MSERLKSVRLGNLISELPKSDLPASATDESGAYHFYCSSSVPKRARSWQLDKPTILMGTGGVASVHLGKGQFAYSTDTWAFRVREQDQLLQEYVFRVLEDALSKIDYAGFEGSGLRHLRKDFIRNFMVRAPGAAQQATICRVLASIDTAIEQTEALIEKYQHIKAGLMHDFFTRGVLPNGQLRPPREQAPELYQETAIGWIPREWRLRPLGEMARVVSGVTLGAKIGPTDTIDAPYLRVANVQDGYLDLSEIKTVRISPKTLEQLSLEPGDVLMNEGGDFDKLGRGAVWQGEIENCVHQNHVFRVRCNAGTLLPTYLAFYSESAFGKKYFVMSSKQSTNLASINSTQLKAYPVALPPLAEQAAITMYVQQAKRRQDTLKVEATKLQIQKLGLMQDLLTGKVPVSVDAPSSEAAA